ncbi:hypothetical protein VTN31DRAFT_5879 [Thermomyces dupontii]|uniref:uncharacterized protein n=1 Tax=Talaromyces thermophilus TaxID=28565 RepID=UPI0037429078
MHSAGYVAWALLGVLAQTAHSKPFPLPYEGILLEPRQCDNPCGFYGQICCTASQICSTNDQNEAVCVDAGTSESWKVFTTTFTTTGVQTVTSVYSSLITAPPKSAGFCDASIGETQCGTVCCDVSETCEKGVCVKASSSAPANQTDTAAPPVRPTDATTVTATPTTTEGFIAPIGTDGEPVVTAAPSGGGLSGGQIAGIVIGTLAGVTLLVFICFSVCLRGIFDRIMGVFGLGRRRRTESYVEEHSHVSHHTAPDRRTWFGYRPSEPRPPREKKSGLGFWSWILVIAGAIALCLGLKRREERDEKSDYSSSYYGPGSSYYYYPYSDYYTSTSSSSSDRRTRRTRDSRPSRPSRMSRS